MAAKLFPLLLILFIFKTNPTANAEADHHPSLHLMNDTLEWEFQPQLHIEPEIIEEAEAEEDEDGLPRRSLYWKPPAPRRYYISYGALSANRVPCPPRSGRSYYTHNCYKAHGPVHPYTRGCSAITLCRR